MHVESSPGSSSYRKGPGAPLCAGAAFAVTRAAGEHRAAATGSLSVAHASSFVLRRPEPFGAAMAADRDGRP